MNRKSHLPAVTETYKLVTSPTRHTVNSLQSSRHTVNLSQFIT